MSTVVRPKKIFSPDRNAPCRKRVLSGNPLPTDGKSFSSISKEHSGKHLQTFSKEKMSKDSRTLEALFQKVQKEHVKPEDIPLSLGSVVGGYVTPELSPPLKCSATGALFPEVFLAALLSQTAPVGRKQTGGKLRHAYDISVRPHKTN